MADSSRLTTLENQTKIFQSITNSIFHVASLPVSIWVPDDDETNLQIVASAGLPKNFVQSAYLDLDQPSVMTNAYKENKIQKVMDIESDSLWKYKEQAQEMNWKSAICVPIEADNVVIGVISVYTYRESSISELAYILPDFARQIGITIEADRRNEVLQRILATGEKLQSMTESLRDALNAIVKNA